MELAKRAESFKKEYVRLNSAFDNDLRSDRYIAKKALDLAFNTLMATLYLMKKQQ